LAKIILADCFINDVGTVLTLGLVFANYNLYLMLFAVVTIAVVAVLPWIVPWLFKWMGKRASEPEIKFLFSEAVLPAYLVGMALAPFFMDQKELQGRMRAICFAFLTPFYFLKAGSLIDVPVLAASMAFIAVFPLDEDVDQDHWDPAAHALFRVRKARRYVHDIDDVNGSDLWVNFGAVRTNQPHHRPEPIYNPIDGGDWQCGAADSGRSDLVQASFRAVGGRRIACVIG
jgi:hypothetical protein